jgi:hypothetical protein
MTNPSGPVWAAAFVDLVVLGWFALVCHINHQSPTTTSRRRAAAA